MVYIMSTNLGSIWSNKKHNNGFGTPKPRVNKTIIKQNDTIRRDGSNSKSYWGTPTWFLFHTIAARINENWYRQNYTIVWEFITKCCSTLPCPFCRSHAIAFVQFISSHWHVA